MKAKILLLVFFISLTFLHHLSAQSNSSALTGAWQIKEGDKEHVLIIQGRFFLSYPLQ
jgi:hypothetical protein